MGEGEGSGCRRIFLHPEWLLAISIIVGVQRLKGGIRINPGFKWN